VLLAGVFTSNPEKGDRLKRLDGHENEGAWECGAPFFICFLSLLAIHTALSKYDDSSPKGFGEYNFDLNQRGIDEVFDDGTFVLCIYDCFCMRRR
jgi:hypothetical protein